MHEYYYLFTSGIVIGWISICLLNGLADDFLDTEKSDDEGKYDTSIIVSLLFTLTGWIAVFVSAGGFRYFFYGVVTTGIAWLLDILLTHPGSPFRQK